MHLEAVDKSNATDKSKNAILLTIAGSEALDIYNTFVFTEADKVTDSEVIKHSSLLTKFDDYCNPIKNETYERYIFRSTIQKPLEPIDHFITDVKSKVKSCTFVTLESSLV